VARLLRRMADDSLRLALLAPLAWWLARRIPIERTNWLRGIGIHLPLSLALALVEEILFAVITPLFGLPWFPRNVFATFRAVVPIDWLLQKVPGTGTSVQLKLHATQLENQLAQAKVNALKMQLHPHFLFNTLHAIVVLVRQHRTDEADQMLTNLYERIFSSFLVRS